MQTAGISTFETTTETTASERQSSVNAYFQAFSTTTVIRVFNFIRTADFCVERLFWLAVLVCFSGATILNVTQTIQTFLAEPTASQVSYVSGGANGLSFPDVKICLNVPSQILLELYEEKLSINDSIVRPDFLQSLETKLNEIHARETARGQLFLTLIQNVSLRDFGIHLVGRYHQFDESTASAFGEAETALLGVTTAMLVHLVDPELNPTPVDDGWPSAAVKNLYEAYVSQDTDFSKLIRLTAEAVCVLLQVRLLSLRANIRANLRVYTPYNFCKRSLPIFFGLLELQSSAGDEVICYQLRGEPFTFHSNDDAVLFSAHTEAFFRRSADDRTIIGFDIGGTMSFSQQPVLIVDFNTSQSVSFTLETVSTSLNLRRSGCLEKASRKGVHFQCELWCRVESIARACDCWPLIATLTPQFGELPRRNSPSCALRGKAKKADECQRTLSSPYDLENCSQICQNQNCETMIFSSTLEADSSFSNLLNATTAVQFFMDKLIYERVEEYITMGAKELVASLGGNLSLYLGASFLALLHMLVFFAKLPFELLRK